jgi:hypothetical protein
VHPKKGKNMSRLIVGLAFMWALSAVAGQLDLRKFQYPVEDAKASAKNAVPRFCTFITSEGGKPRLPGVGRDKVATVVGKYRTKLMNEYRLYEKGEIDIQEKYLLERYCTRYNRMLISELGI